MTAKALLPTEAELVSSLTEDDIPTKLRCAICSKLAVNAFKLPCCEQLIDENCHATLPSTCPVCEHTPISAADCNPNKVMRSTIRVFIKTELKKRETLRSKQPREATPVTSAIPVEALAPGSILATAVVDDVGTADATGEAQQQQGTTEDAEKIAETAPAETASAEQVQSTEPVTDKDAEDLTTDQGVQAGDRGSQEVSAQPGNNFVSGSNNADNMGGFHGIYSAVNNGVGGDMNQMQMMMAMQNGMMPGGFNFPMMGMVGMNMDPSMQGMYMNGGFPNMMSGGRFDGTGGGNGLNNWDGQQAWNGGGQNNFHYPNAPLGMNGEFGSFNVGFQPGYNQQFGYQTQNQFNNYRGFGRGRGRGRGYFNNGNGYGRGGYYNNGSNVNFNQGNEFGYNGMNNNNFNYQQGQGVGYQQDQQEANAFGNGAGKEIGKDAPSGDSGTGAGDNGGTETVPNESVNLSVEASTPLVRDDSSNSGAPIPVLDTRNVVGRPMQNQFGMFNNVTAGQQGINGIPKGPSPDVPLNAPSGPKAMRQGLRNTSALHLRARGLIRDDQPEKNNGHDAVVDVSDQNSPMAELSGHGRSRSNSVSGQRHDRDRQRDRSKDRGRNRSDYSSRDRSLDQDYGNRSSQRHSDQNGHSHSDYKRTNDQNQAPVGEDHLAADNRRHVLDEDLDYEHQSEWEDDGLQRGSDRDDRDDRDDRNSVNGLGRSESRSTNGREREPSQDSLGPDNEQPAEIVQGSAGAKSRRNRHRGGRRHRRNRHREDGQPAAKPSSGGDVTRSRSTSPVDDSRRSNGHRSHRERDREHRDRSRDRDRDRDDHRRRPHRNEERDRDREAKTHRERDRSRDEGRRGKDRHDRRDRDRERGRDKSRDTGSAAKVSFEIKGASSKGQANGHGSKNTSNGVSGGGSSDPYAAERERRTRERMAAEAQKRAGISSLVGGNGNKRGRDDFEEGGGGGSSGGGRRNRRKGRRGDAVATDENGDRRRGDSERDDHR
ncbi:hypothetical protein SEPCBS57363_005785 [Sporothrix epigloea]|uniref:RING-type domain-containing protein n=1 Tax=Sporothrix epigloea TaxID=1892477 RepID=A0ABP0E3L2_9PEZI